MDLNTLAEALFPHIQKTPEDILCEYRPSASRRG